VVIDEVEHKDRTDQSPNFFHFKNQQSSLDNHQSVPRDAVRSCLRMVNGTKARGIGF
jgi:hypothetical protein